MDLRPFVKTIFALKDNNESSAEFLAQLKEEVKDSKSFTETEHKILDMVIDHTISTIKYNTEKRILEAKYVHSR